MKNTTVFRVIFFIAIIILCIVKWSDLSLPYYWDELGVYSRAALYLFDHKVSLQPVDLPVELSRGHPLLCAFLYGSLFRITGPDLFYGHLFSLSLSIALAALTYATGKKYFSEKTGFTAGMLLLVQPVFIAQSTLILPEIMLALFCLASIYYYLGNRYFLAGLFGGLAILTKETAIVMPLAFLITEVIKYITGKNSLSKLLTNASVIFIPYYFFIIFLIVQRIQNGWFFFPYHTGFISFDPENIYWRTVGYLKFIFIQQGRFTWTILLAIALIIHAVKQKKHFFQRFAELFKFQSEKDIILFTLILYTLGVVGFSALNFPLNRYLLLAFPIFCLLIATLLTSLSNDRSALVQYTTWLLIPIPLFFLYNKKFVNDEDMSFKHQVIVQKNVFDYFNSSEAILKDKVVVADFPMDFGFMDTRAGYIKTINYKLKPLAGTYYPEADYYIYSNPGNLPDEQKIIIDKVELVKEFQSSYARAYIYKNKAKAF